MNTFKHPLAFIRSLAIYLLCALPICVSAQTATTTATATQTGTQTAAQPAASQNGTVSPSVATGNTDTTGTAATPAINGNLRLPKLSAIKVRVDETLEMGSGDKKNAPFINIQALRTQANESVKAMAAGPGSKLTDKDTGKVIEAAHHVLALCNMGSDYIHARIRKNSSSEFWVGAMGALFGVGTAVSNANPATKVLGLATALSENYKTSVVQHGDSGRNSTELRAILDDIRVDLSTALGELNSAMRHSTQDTSDQLERHRRMQAAVMELHQTCSMF